MSQERLLCLYYGIGLPTMEAMKERTHLVLTEREAAELIEQGKEFTLVLKYDEHSHAYDLHAKAVRGKEYVLQLARGGVKRVKDADKAVLWARKMGFKAVEMRAEF